MAYSEAIVKRAQEKLDAARTQNEREFETGRDAIFEKVPRLAEIDRELRKTAVKVYAAAFRSGSDPAQAVMQLKKENQALQREREWLLESNDLDPDDLEPTPICSACGGSGWRGGRMCGCLKELCRQEQKAELSRALGTEKGTFEKFNPLVYTDRFDQAIGVSPRELMQKTAQKLRRYAQSFTPQSPSLLFLGATGLGKTYLSACVARAVADNGFGVEYVTAEKLVAELEAEKFHAQQSQDRTKVYFDCDLLVLDDLGTELTNQFTVTALYQVINTRLCSGKPTIVSSNIPVGELEARYSAQIASRLLGSYTIYKFYGSDIRLQK